MNRSNDERLLDLRALVRERLERDLRALADILHERSELTLHDILDEMHNVYVHYIKQNALLDNAAATMHRSDSRLQEELNRLRSIDS